MVKKTFSMNIGEVLELEYLIEQISNNNINVTDEPSNDASSMDYISRESGIFNPSETGTYKIDINGQTVEIEVTDIPDSVASRSTNDSDNNSVSTTGDNGLVIETKSEWPSIGARISSNTSGATTARLEDNADGTLIASVDISGLASGDAFTFDNVDLIANKKYNILLNAEGSDYTNGYFDGTASYPYTSDDLDITARIYKGTEDTINPINISEVGNVGFN